MSPPAGEAVERPCQGVRLEQHQAGLLSIRFLAPLRGRGGAAFQLMFTGVLEPTSEPMRCGEGRCEFDGVIGLQVSALAITAFDREGLPLGLPEPHLAEGRCRVSGREVLCRARSVMEREWQARARW